MPEFFVHPQGLCDTAEVGPRTRIWAFAHVLEGARIGADCNICETVFIESDVVVGDRVTIKNGVQLWDGVVLEDDVFVGPNATFTNDPFPRSRQWRAEHPRLVVRRGASVGANATILPGLEVGVGAMVAAGAVVTRSVPPHAVVAGNPARIIGYAESDAAAERPAEQLGPPAREAVARTAVEGVTVHRFSEHGDLRGNLTVGHFEVPAEIPFAARRWFMVHGVPTPEVRGEHAHRVCEQFLICVSGSVRLVVDDGENRSSVLLDDPSIGVYIPPMVWGTQYGYTSDSTLLVFASHEYDPDDYIRRYDEFLELRRAAQAG